MFLWSVLALLGAVLFALGVYSYPYWTNEVSASGEITISALPQLVGMIIEILAIVKLAAHLQDRKWYPTRDAISQDIADDIDELSFFVAGAHAFENGQRHPFETRQELKQSVIPFMCVAQSRQIENTLQLLSPAMNAEQMAFVAQYNSIRQRMQESFRDVLRDSVLPFFAERDHKKWQQAIDEWDADSEASMPNEHLYWGMSWLESLLQLARDNPRLGWKTGGLIPLIDEQLSEALAAIHLRLPELVGPAFRQKVDAARPDQKIAMLGD